MSKSLPFVLFATSLALGASACIPQSANLKRQYAGVDRVELDSAKRNDGDNEIRKMCRKPPVHEKSILFIPWTDAKISKEACEHLKTRFDKNMETGIADAKAARGGACLSTLRDTWTITSLREGQEALKWETDEARRAQLTPVAEECIAEMEGWASAGEHDKVFAALHKKINFIETPALTSEQWERTTKLWNQAVASAGEVYVAASDEAQVDTPYAGALYLAAAALVADEAGDEDQSRMRLSKAKALVSAAKEQSRLTIGLEGRGFAGEVTQKMLGGGYSNDDVVLGTRGELKLSISLDEPKLSSGQKDVTRYAEIQVKGPDVKNPAYAKVEEKCEEEQRDVEKYRERCSSNGPKDHNCSKIEDSEKDVVQCKERLSEIKPTVPSMTTEKIPYDAVEYSASARGSITIAVNDERPNNSSLFSKVANYKHGAVPRANVSASSAGPIDKSRAMGKYVGDAIDKVRSVIRKQLDKRGSVILKQVENATTPAELAEKITQYYRYNYIKAEKLDLESMGTRIGLPLKHSLEKLLRKNAY